MSSAPGPITVGVDLATDPSRTAIAVIEWGADTARLIAHDARHG